MMWSIPRRPRARRVTTLGFSQRGVSLVCADWPVAGARPRFSACDFCPVEADDEWRASVQELGKRHRISKDTCTVVMDKDSYTLLLVEAPDVPAEELRAALRWRIRDLIDFHVDEAVIDVFDIPARRASRGNALVYAVAAERARIMHYVDLVSSVGLRLQAIDIPELAQRNLAAQFPEDQEGLALLSVCDGVGLITLTREETLYLARRFSLGGAGEGAGDWADAIVMEVQRSLDYYESNFAQPPIKHLLIGPLPAGIPDCAERVSSDLALNARSLNLGELVGDLSPMVPAEQAGCVGALGGAFRTETLAL